jgi:hypothetical protein
VVEVRSEASSATIAIGVDDAGTRVAADGASRENATYFSSWGVPEARTKPSTLPVFDLEIMADIR